jgi:hypothetical protein
MIIIIIINLTNEHSHEFTYIDIIQRLRRGTIGTHDDIGANNASVGFTGEYRYR